jgi:hypothetical protein
VNAPAPTRNDPAPHQASADADAQTTSPKRKPAQPELGVWTCAQNGDGASTSATLREVASRVIALDISKQLPADARARSARAHRRPPRIDSQEVSAAEKGAPLQHPVRRKATTTTRNLRLISETDTPSRSETEGTRPRTKPALAVYRLECSSNKPLPGELARQLIAHYTDRGDLVLATQRASNALPQARRLDRRARPLSARRRCACETGVRGEAVIALRPNERADLAIGALNANASERRASHVAAQLSARLKPGAFLVLVFDDARDHLGAIVHACQQQGLRYWQHVVALDAAAIDCEPSDEDVLATERRRSIRCHRDLLVFRRPAHTNALAGEAAGVAEVAV